jgi:hypothetical protein
VANWSSGTSSRRDIGLREYDKLSACKAIFEANETCGKIIDIDSMIFRDLSMSDTDPPPAPEPVPKKNLPFGAIFAPHSAGMSIFSISCITLLVLVIVINLPGIGAGFADYKVLRSFELILTVAGLGIIISFLGRESSAVAVIFGFLVIAALIVPTRDIVRFALLATGSEKRLNDYYETSSVGANLSGRVPDVAAAIIREVDKELALTNLGFSPAQQERLRKVAQDIIRDDRVLTLVEKVKARGVFELLKSVDANEAQQFLYRFSDNDRLQDDIAFLRYEDLVSLAYDDVSTIRSTTLGRLVVQREQQLWTEDQETGVVGFGGRFSEGSSFPQCDSVPFGSFDQWERLSFDDTQQIERAIGSTEIPQFLRLKVLPGEIGAFEISFVQSSQDNSLDPMMSLFSLAASTNAEEASRNCTEISSNDDIAPPALGAQIGSNLEQGEYLIWLGTFAGPGEGTLKIRREFQEQGTP